MCVNRRLRIFTACLLSVLFSFTHMFLATAESDSLLLLKCIEKDAEHFFLSVSVSGFYEVTVFGVPIGFNPNSVQLCGYNEKEDTFFDLESGVISKKEADSGIIAFSDEFTKELGYTVIYNDFYPKVDNDNGIIGFISYRFSPQEANQTELYRICFKRISDEPAQIRIAKEGDGGAYDEMLPNGASFYFEGNEMDYDIVYDGNDFISSATSEHHEGDNSYVVKTDDNYIGENYIQDNPKQDTDKNDLKTDDVIYDNQSEHDKKALFSDLDESHWAYGAISALAEKGIISGYEDGTFMPNKDITRAEIAKITTMAIGVNTEDANITGFSDVNGNEWFAKYLASAVNANIFAGYEDGTLRPLEPVTRQDLCCVLYRAFFEDSQDNEAVLSFSDSADVSDYAIKAVAYMYDRKILSGRGDNMFCPKDRATRAEVAKLVYMCMNEKGE